MKEGLSKNERTKTDPCRLFVMSNTSISMEDSNGRTLANLLSLFTKDEVFNFYLHGQPQFDRAHFYRLSDREALHFRKKAPFRK